ncbi:MAG: GDYXXLXY domain-containing protein [Pleurocapsa sp.]
MVNSANFNSFPIWRFVVPLGLQLGLILLVPAKSAYTYTFGTDVVIQTAPVDPYDLLRGYSQTLNYDISSVNELEKLSGEKNLEPGETFYVILESPKEKNTPPLPWNPIQVMGNLPENLPPNSIAIKGLVKQYRTAVYGLETYYMPEDRRQEINRKINNLANSDRRPFVVEIKVDPWGNSVPVSLWIEEEKYRF